MKKFFLLTLIGGVFLTSNTAYADEVVASFEIPFRIEGGSVLRLATKVPKAANRLAKTQCYALSLREGLRLKTVVTGIESIVVQRQTPEGSVVAEGTVAVSCTARNQS